MSRGSHIEQAQKTACAQPGLADQLCQGPVVATRVLVTRDHLLSVLCPDRMRLRLPAWVSSWILTGACVKCHAHEVVHCRCACRWHPATLYSRITLCRIAAASWLFDPRAKSQKSIAHSSSLWSVLGEGRGSVPLPCGLCILAVSYTHLTLPTKRIV